MHVGVCLGVLAVACVVICSDALMCAAWMEGLEGLLGRICTARDVMAGRGGRGLGLERGWGGEEEAGRVGSEVGPVVSARVDGMIGLSGSR